MTEDRFDELLRDAAHTYNRPPAEPPLDEMWSVIEQRRQRGPRALRDDAGPSPFLKERRRSAPARVAWLRMAAVLVIGLGLGRASVSLRWPASETEQPVAQQEARPRRPHDQATNNYLGQTAALLIALPGELRSSGLDSAFVSRADDLLMQTRLLLDSPAAADPALRALFEDLEVVLVQLVRLQSDRDPTRVEILNDALQQRDVIPRLRNAVVDHIAD